MNFKPLIFRELANFSEENPEYSFAELIYTVIQTKKPKGLDCWWVTKMDDHEVYTAIEKATEKERNLKEKL